MPGSRLGQGGRALRETFAIVRREALTVCDARYWEMELRRGLPLATTDRAMRQSAHKLALAGSRLMHQSQRHHGPDQAGARRARHATSARRACETS